ncbi:MAG: hypothetical protein HY868_13180 [Chloroflexi bacterium]|nr:hypothetical protein [Chloroflexota bacterium]
MTRIRCRDRQCTFNKSGLCTADEIEYEPDAGCLTMEPREESDEEERDEWEGAEGEDWEEDDDWEEDEDDWEEDEDEEVELEDDDSPRPATKKKPGRR